MTDPAFNMKYVRRLCDSFRLAEMRDCIRQHAEAFGEWLSPFAVPVESIPEWREDAVGGYCTEEIDIYFLFWIDGDFVFGKPYVPNATDSNLPRDKSIGYRIPVTSLRAVPKIKHKEGYRDRDGYVIG